MTIDTPVETACTFGSVKGYGHYELGVDALKNIYYRRVFADKAASDWLIATGVPYFLAKEILQGMGYDLREEPQYRQP